MNESLDWPGLLRGLARELAALEPSARLWLEARITAIEALQRKLDALFAVAGGAQACCDCAGACCEHGLHHLTLTNLLGDLLRGEEPPPPDPARSCPYLGDRGCRLPAERRPYNCITFFCERLEENLDDDSRAALRELDRRLRSEYQRVAERYPAATLRGLRIGLSRCGEQPLLRSAGPGVLE